MRHSLNRGFTVPELIVVIVVIGSLVGVLFSPLNDLYTSNNRGVQSIVETGDVRGTLRDIETEIATAISFRNTNTGAISDPTGSNNNPSSPTQWTWTGIAGDGTSNRVLIATKYGTTILPNLDTNGTRTLVYANDCETPLTNVVLFFVRNSVLYRRTLVNTAATCPGYAMAQRTTCATGVVHASCQGTDAKLIDNVISFSVNYYDDPDSTGTIANQYTDTAAPSNSQSVSITLTTGSSTIQKTSTLRITRLNGTTL